MKDINKESKPLFLTNFGLFLPTSSAAVPDIMALFLISLFGMWCTVIIYSIGVHCLLNGCIQTDLPKPTNSVTTISKWLTFALFTGCCKCRPREANRTHPLLHITT